MPWKNKDRRHKQVTIDDPPSEYYSSDEQDSDSEDDLNKLGPLPPQHYIYELQTSNSHTTS